MANPIRLALHGALSGDAALKAIVGDRIHFQKAPQGTPYPMLIFHKHTGRPRRTMSGPQANGELWVCKGVATGSGSAAVAESIADAIDDVLEGAKLEGTLSVLREEDVDYGREDGADLYRYCGAMYRIWVG